MTLKGRFRIKELAAFFGSVPGVLQVVLVDVFTRLNTSWTSLWRESGAQRGFVPDRIHAASSRRRAALWSLHIHPGVT